MYCNVNSVAATTSDQLIAASSWFAFTIPTEVTALHCIATGGSTTQRRRRLGPADRRRHNLVIPRGKR
jgi:hypothetical protein